MHELERVTLSDHVAVADAISVDEDGRSRLDREYRLDNRPRLRHGQPGQRKCLHARPIDHLDVCHTGRRRIRVPLRRATTRRRQVWGLSSSNALSQSPEPFHRNTP
jgi:hypothetical protein